MTNPSVMKLLLCCVLWWGTASAALAAPPVILILGDSLSAAYGIAPDTGWVALLESRLRQQGYPHQVVNASISGETTSGGRRRLPELLAVHRPALVVVELGANDGLRGFDLAEISDNLHGMLTAIDRTGAQSLVVRMEVPPNYGPAYAQGFAAVYDRLVKLEPPLAMTPVLAPFFLAEVILDPELMQSDGLHPTARAQPRLLDTLWPALEPLIDSHTAERS
ncbi:MAG: arylesterase [Gammaproteobacteria bacterium]|nr:arylesterase [Gammaproteobacteria bacterium]